MVTYLPVLIGTPALTSRQMKEAEMQQVANFIDEGVELAAVFKTGLQQGSTKAIPYKVG